MEMKEVIEQKIAENGNSHFTTKELVWYLIHKLDSIDDKLDKKTDKKTTYMLVTTLSSAVVAFIGYILYTINSIFSLIGGS